MADQPRGIRNNNPGNIEHGAPWQGLASVQSDDRFCSFIEPKWGIRAIARILITYQDKHKINTVLGIIDRWAPPQENDTEAYIEHVASVLGVDANSPINVHEYKVMRPLVEAIIKHENGVQPYSLIEINEGLRLAGVEPEPSAQVAALDEHRPLTKSRTVRGSQVAGAAGSIAAAAGIAQEIAPALPVLNWVRDNLSFALIALGVAVLAGVAYAVYARYDDRQKGRN